MFADIFQETLDYKKFIFMDLFPILFKHLRHYYKQEKKLNMSFGSGIVSKFRF